MPRSREWLPPSEGIHFCNDYCGPAVQLQDVFDAVPVHYRVTSTIRNGTRKTHLWTYYTCRPHFNEFRNLMHYPRPSQGKYQRVPTPDDAPFLKCDHIDGSAIHTRIGLNGKIYVTSIDCLVYELRGSYHRIQKSNKLWLFLSCLDCYLMHRSLIEKPMPLSYGYETPTVSYIGEEAIRNWNADSYGFTFPPWPPEGRRTIKWCDFCQAPTVRINNQCASTLHEENADRLGDVERSYCDSCKITTYHASQAGCLRCSKYWTEQKYGVSEQ